MVAQTFFSLAILMTIFASRRWIESEGTIIRIQDSSAFGLRTLSILATLAVYMQLFLGGAFRHGGLCFWIRLKIAD